MKNLYIKIITGYRDDQSYSVPAEEAHKAYYLFLNPNQRGVFDNGLALRGQDIQKIEPDYHATMGWNKTWKLDDSDWNDIRRVGVDKKLQKILYQAKQIAQMDNPPVHLTLSEAAKTLPRLTENVSHDVVLLAEKMKI